ncbi:unnamed protein product [Closterium sp. NIES-53]
MSLEVWKSEHGPASEQTPTVPPTDNSTTTLPLLAKVSEPAAEDVEDVPSPFPSPAPRAPPHVADLRGLTPVSASGDEGRSGALPMAPAKSIDSGQRDVPQVDVRVKSTLPGEEQAKELPPMVVKSAKGAAARQQPTGEQAAAEPTTEQSATGQSAGEPTVVQLDAEGSGDSDDEGEAEDSTDSDMVEVQGGPRRTGRLSRPPDFVVPAAFTTVYDVDADDLVYDDAEDDDEDFPELVPDMHADPEHRWEISTMMVKEALASWKGKAVGRHGGGDPQPRQHGDVGAGRTPAASEHHEEPGFTQVYGTDYDETYAPVSSYVMLRIFLSIVAILDLNLMQLDMKNAFLRSKLEWVLYIYQPDFFNDGTGRVCKLLKSLYDLKQSPLLWYRAHDGVLLGAGWKKSQVDMALYFKVGDNKVTCWVLVYVNDLLATSNGTEMLKELKELLEATFEQRAISSMQKYLGLEIVRDPHCASSSSVARNSTPSSSTSSSRVNSPSVSSSSSSSASATSASASRSSANSSSVTSSSSSSSNATSASAFSSSASRLRRVSSSSPSCSSTPNTTSPSSSCTPGTSTSRTSSCSTSSTTSSSINSNTSSSSVTSGRDSSSGGSTPKAVVAKHSQELQKKKYPKAQHPQTPHPQTQHPQAPHPQAQHPQAPHHQAQRPQAQHPQTRHPQTQHPLAPHSQTQHPQTQYLKQHLSRQLPRQAQYQGEGLPKIHLREQDPGGGGGLPEGDLEQGRAAGRGDDTARGGVVKLPARRVRGKAKEDAANSAGGELVRGRIANKGTKFPDSEHRRIANLPSPTQCRRGLRQGDARPEVELMHSVADRKRPQKMGSSRMDHGGTSDLHD